MLISILFIFHCASVEEKYVEAAAEGNLELMEELSTKKGNLLNAREERNWTALIAAASVGKTKVVNYLIQKKAYLNLRTNLGDTALYRASAKGYSEIVKNLLEAGANPNIKDKKGDTPLMKAASKGNIEVMRLLLEAKVNPNEILSE